MGIIITIVLILIIGFIASMFITKSVKEDNYDKFTKLGYHFIDFLSVNYRGGIKNISINNDVVSIKLLKEGINFSCGTSEKTILFDNITDISLQSKQFIQNQVSLGKLFCFGVLAFGMKGKQSTINDEYIVLEVDDEDGKYGILLQAYEQKNNQQEYNKLLKLKNKE